jgi:hypothetical protein
MQSVFGKLSIIVQGITDLFVMTEHAIVTFLLTSFSEKIESSFMVFNYWNTEDKESLFVIIFMLVSILRR